MRLIIPVPGHLSWADVVTEALGPHAYVAPGKCGHCHYRWPCPLVRALTAAVPLRDPHRIWDQAVRPLICRSCKSVWPCRMAPIAGMSVRERVRLIRRMGDIITSDHHVVSGVCLGCHLDAPCHATNTHVAKILDLAQL
jgi:hypothetical protein